MSRVLFLDIDNVLNHGDELEDAVEDNVPLCNGNVEALKHILSEVESILIVWSSSWRMCTESTYNGWKNPMQWLLKQDWIEGKTIGSTPKKMSSVKFEEVHFWLKGNIEDRKHKISNFAILDDEELGMQNFGKHFFRCSRSKGLTEEIAEEVIEYLRLDDYNEEELDWTRKEQHNESH